MVGSGDICGKCKKDIIDETEDSILCDICGNWYHSKKSCSNLKEILFKNIKKNDHWACKACVSFHSKASNKGKSSDFSKVLVELDELRKQLDLVKCENVRLSDELSVKEVTILELNDKICNLTRQIDEMSPDRGSPWRLQCSDGRGQVNGRRPRPSVQIWEIDDSVNFESSNRFEPLVHETEFNAELELSSMEDFPPLRTSNGWKSSLGKNYKQKKGLNGKVKVGTRGRNRTDRFEVKKRVVVKPSAFLIGDSHARGLGERLVGKTQSLVMPGGSLSVLIDSAEKILSRGENIDNGESIIIVGGTNHLSEASVQGVEDRLGRLASGGYRGKMLWVETPMRYDNSKENELIFEQNEVVQKHCRLNNWDFLSLNDRLDRSCYTKHGLHLNIKGKQVICSLLNEVLTRSKNEKMKHDGETSKQAGGSVLNSPKTSPGRGGGGLGIGDGASGDGLGTEVESEEGVPKDVCKNVFEISKNVGETLDGSSKNVSIVENVEES